MIRTRGQYPAPPPRAHLASASGRWKTEVWTPAAAGPEVSQEIRRCVLDGGEIGSTSHRNRRIRLGCDPVRNAKLVNDNDNYVMETRLAA